MNKIRCLNNNHIKLLAAFLMLIDHIGFYLFPSVTILRVIGRLSFPIFAFMVAEGAKYTKNKVKYISLMAAIGIGSQIVPYILLKSLRFNVLITFALALIIIYALDYFKINFFDKSKSIALKIGSGLLFFASVIAAFLLTRIGISYEYGFYGCMMVVFASAPSLDKTNAPEWLKKFDNLAVKILCMAIPLVIFCFRSNWNVQFFSLLALPILFLYSGKKGEKNLKYFFYIFYPAHILFLQLLYMLLYYISINM